MAIVTQFSSQIPFHLLTILTEDLYYQALQESFEVKINANAISATP
jgi:hypothetical protein